MAALSKATQDSLDLKALARAHLMVTRCPSNRLTVSGKVCPHCYSEDSKQCKPVSNPTDNPSAKTARAIVDSGEEVSPEELKRDGSVAEEEAPSHTPVKKSFHKKSKKVKS